MPSAVPPQARLDRYRPLIESGIRRALDRPAAAGSSLLSMLRYHLGLGGGPAGEAAGSGGKLVRGALCLLACEAVGGEPARAVPAAAALELAHGFTLLHDDIMDRDATRRGRPTVWSLWGSSQAITAGDAMMAAASLAAVRLLEERLSPARVCAVLGALNTAVFEVCEGQHLDLAYEGKSEVSPEMYLDMVGRKTGALFAAAAEAGAVVGGAADPLLRAFHEFGRRLGLLFQVRDDTLGIWGDPEALGKPVGGDLVQNKRSLPILHALSAASPFAPRLRACLSAGVTSLEAPALAREMEAAGARAYCERLLRELHLAAETALHTIPLAAGPAQDLRDLAAHLVERRH